MTTEIQELAKHLSFHIEDLDPASWEFTDEQTLQNFREHFINQKKPALKSQPAAPVHSPPPVVKKAAPIQRKPIIEKPRPSPKKPLPPTASKPQNLDAERFFQFFKEHFPDIPLVQDPLKPEDVAGSCAIQETLFLCPSDDLEREEFYQKVVQALQKRKVKASVCCAESWAEEQGWSKLKEKSETLLLIGHCSLLQEALHEQDPNNESYHPYEVGQSFAIPLPDSLDECMQTTHKKTLWTLLTSLLHIH